MKIPNIFLTKKNLDRRIEELNQPHKEKPKFVDIEDLMQNWVSIFYDGIDFRKMTYPEIAEKEKKFESRAFKRIIKDTYSGKIKWKKDSKNPEKYTARATVPNAAGEEITIPTMFTTDDYTPAPKEKEPYIERVGYLHLGDERGPRRSSFEKDVKELASEYFKINLYKVKNMRRKR
ncbi:hypothetical protein FJZ53_02980 [Candidatus Woesearchaeota archaeon]|nr:hypothetical protein [Candidatus Woesearchaeota archaeon]